MASTAKGRVLARAIVSGGISYATLTAALKVQADAALMEMVADGTISEGEYDALIC